jgi:uncharacterized protein with GYD domain|tara:strand:+ start:230 stop:559 length:330 start_codon:yes stop_codon:yes gene_type:complete
MPLYCLQGRYTKAAMSTIIDNKEDRTTAAAAACESVGGKLLGMYGAQGQDYHIMAIADMPSLQSYMALYMKIMQSGAFESLKTVNLCTGADIAAAAAMVGDASYTPPTS